jgi:hypothetical protein
MDCKCQQCGRDYKYDEPPGAGYSPQFCGPFCDGVCRGKQSAAEEADAVYALAKTPIEQARQIPLGQFVATRFVHVEDYNTAIGAWQTQVERLTQLELLSVRLMAAHEDAGDCGAQTLADLNGSTLEECQEATAAWVQFMRTHYGENSRLNDTEEEEAKGSGEV